MILKEATGGGVVTIDDWFDSEKELPEDKRVQFPYGALTTRERIDLLHRSANASGNPNGADVCLAAIDGKGMKIKNLFHSDGTPIYTVGKCLSYEGDNFLAYLIELVGLRIWSRQNLSEARSKNSESPSTADGKDTSSPPQ